MKENKMAEVAELLKLKLGEEFEVEGSSYNPFKFTEHGLFDSTPTRRAEIFMDLVTGLASFSEIPWRPQCGDTYYYVCANGQIYNNTWEDDEIDYALYSFGNYFKTERKAEANKADVIANIASFKESD